MFFQDRKYRCHDYLCALFVLMSHMFIVICMSKFSADLCLLSAKQCLLMSWCIWEFLLPPFLLASSSVI